MTTRLSRASGPEPPVGRFTSAELPRVSSLAQTPPQSRAASNPGQAADPRSRWVHSSRPIPATSPPATCRIRHRKCLSAAVTRPVFVDPREKKKVPQPGRRRLLPRVGSAAGPAEVTADLGPLPIRFPFAPTPPPGPATAGDGDGDASSARPESSPPACAAEPQPLFSMLPRPSARTSPRSPLSINPPPD